MGDHSPEDINKHVRIYQFVLVALLVLTVVTVWASYWQIGVALGVVVGLIIATVKGSLVAGYFMHLVGEKPIVMYVLLLTFVFFAVMIGLILGAYYDGTYI